MLKCIVTFSYNKYLKLSWLVRTGVTEVTTTKSLTESLHVAFLLVRFAKGYLGVLELMWMIFEILGAQKLC